MENSDGFGWGQVGCIFSHCDGYRAARLQGHARRGRVHGDITEGPQEAFDQKPFIATHTFQIERPSGRFFSLRFLSAWLYSIWNVVGLNGYHDLTICVILVAE